MSLQHRAMAFSLLAILLTGAVQAGDESPSLPRLSTPAKDRHGDPLPAGAIARLGTERFRCLGDVSTLAISPNGKWLAVCSMLGDRFTLLDAMTGKSLPTPQSMRFIKTAAFSPDNRHLATATGQTVEVWDATTFEKVASFSRPSLVEGELGSAVCLAFSPDGKFLATGHTDNALTYWDWKAGKALGDFQGHRGWVSRVFFTPDGQRLVSGSWDATTRIWDIAARKSLRTVDEGLVALSPDGKVLVTVPERSAIIHVQMLAGDNSVRTLQVPGKFVLTGAINSDGSTLAVNSSVEQGHVQIEDIHLFDLRTGKHQRSLSGNINGAWPVLFSPEGTLVISGGRETRGNAVRFWNCKTGERVRQFVGHENSVVAAAFLADGQSVATAGADGVIRLWDASNGRELRCLTGPRARLGSLSVSPDGFRLAAESSDGSVFVWPIKAEESPVRILCQPSPQRVAFTPDGGWLAVGTSDGEVRLYHPATGKLGRSLATIPEGKSGATVLTYAPDGKTLAWGGYLNDIHLIDAASGKEQPSLAGHRFWVRSLAYSPEGRWLASGSDDGSARIWDLKTGASQVLYQDPRKHEIHSVTAVAFSPDGALLITGHETGQMRLWETMTRQQIAEVIVHKGEITTLDFAPGGWHFVSGSTDTAALVWDLSAVVLGALGATEPDWKAEWTNLASEKAVTGQRAVWSFRAGGEAGVKYLDERLQEMYSPEKVKGMDQAVRHFENLDSSDFRVREQAGKELERLGLALLPGLRKRLQGKPTLEVTRRLERLVQAIEGQAEGQRRQFLRALQVLEISGTGLSRVTLERLAKEEHEPEKVEAALRRLRRKDAKR